MRIRVLGPVEVEVDGRPVDPGGPRQRAVLALLLVGRGEVVSVDRMIDQLWRGEPPPRAIASLQAYVSNLRKLLEPQRAQRTPATLLVSRAPGYVLRLPTDAVDAWHFESLLQQGQRATTAAEGLALVSRALRLWQGPAYAEVADEDWAAAEAARLAELRLVARELAVELTVRAGRSTEAVPEAELLTHDHPLREEGWRLLAEALWASGRQGDALAALRRARRVLDEELGLDPGPALTGLEDAILHQRLDRLPVPESGPVTAPVAEPATDGPFVGREAELRRIRDLAARARTGGGLGLITGEAGLGKSSLLARVRRTLTADGWTVVVGRCPEVDGAPSGWAWSEALGQLTEPPPDRAAVAPLIDPQADAGDTADAASGRFRLHRAAVGWLRAAAGKAPLAVFLDDLHRADGETLALLESAARELDGVPVLVLCAYRPGEGGDRLDEALGTLARREPERIALSGLPAHDVEALITAVRGQPAEAEVVSALTDRTGGNPFYVRESARLMESEGALVALAEVPEGVRDVLRRRLARLPQPAVAVLRLAAVVGRESDVDVLVSAAETGEEAVLEALETGVLAGLLGEPAPGRVRFAHALVRDTLYADLARLRRSRMHGRVAAVFRELRPDDLDALAHHYSLTAGADELAWQYGLRAAEQAERRYAHDSVVRLLERAGEALDRMPLTSDVEDRRSELLGRLLRAHLRAGALEAGRAVRQRALDAARAAGRDDLVIAAFTAWTVPTPLQARQYGVIDRPVVATLAGLLDRPGLDAETRIRLLDAFVAEMSGEHDPRVLAAAEEAVALARTLGDPELLALALATGMRATHADPYVERRHDLAVELTALVAERDQPALRWYAGWAFAADAGTRSDLPDLRARLAEGQRIAQRYRMPEAETIHHFGNAMLAHIAGDFTEAERIYLSAAEVLRRAGSVHADGFLVMAICTLRLSQGRIGEMEPALHALMEHYPETGDALALALVANGRRAEAPAARAGVPPVRPDYWFSVFSTMRALAAVALESRDEAPALIEALLPFRDRLPGVISVTLTLQPVALTLGQLYRLLGQEDAARREFAHAEKVAATWNSPHWTEAARAALSG